MPKLSITAVPQPMPPTPALTPWQRHKARWDRCRLCQLCQSRKSVVLARGEIPAEVIFVGEAPGESEDVVGLPFVGPAGKLLDHITARAWDMLGRVPRCLYTNLVACIPREGDDRTAKAGEPPTWAMEKCAPRLAELAGIAKPKFIIAVGALAQKHLGNAIDASSERWTIGGIVHPAAVLRADAVKRETMIRRAVAQLASLIGRGK